MSTIKVQNIQDLEQKFLQLVQITRKMRYWEKKWHQHYGATNRKAMQVWQDRADEFLAELNIEEYPNEKLQP